MLFFIDVRVEPKNLSPEELWALWEQEADAALAAKGAGKIVNLWKVAGQRRVLAILDAESNDEIDRIFMGALPMAHNLEFQQILPIREYEGFAKDVRNRWKS